jgi:hypothetical protein
MKICRFATMVAVKFELCSTQKRRHQCTAPMFYSGMVYMSVLTLQGKPKKKHVPSGYIVFAGECRKKIQEENSDLSFGDISKIVGTKVSFS